ncbi:uncharacterized protein BO66DRAFT_472686 [Aspergillus aculeatinus CBS 121060]|uniref:Uncharacterized protein n=1 Tax=Aspergillus aculeatinus CBS 121060 TaxID=1448322 RepID=A0ACD1H4U5_9EURO|nr:hypothetical protein BO66DRAFT_472686 [Aspergillus aculeatinus CBS 121060]RAH68484.1 hypothetical protein BO66DRAFT_472686 [Aspergillus aculeatinus CBS 121060]
MPRTRAQKRPRINIAGDACNRDVSPANCPGPSDATPIKDRAPTPESQGRAAVQEVHVPAEQAIPALLEIWADRYPNSDHGPPLMREITRYIDEVIDRGRDPDPQIHERIKKSMWRLGSRVSFARYPEMVSNILAVKLPDMHHLDTERMVATVARYIMSLMDSILSQCGPLASEVAKLDGLQSLIQIGLALTSIDAGPSRDSWIEFYYSEVFFILSSSMHMIIAGMQIGEPAVLAYCGEVLVLQVEKLHREIQKVYVLYDGPSTFDSEAPFPRPWSDDASPETEKLV